MDLFSLVARLTLDKSNYDQGLDDASSHAKSFGSKLASGLKTAAKVGAVALSAAATGIAAITKQSVDQYAAYEQLVGGVETLFKSSAGIVQQYAANAYKTAGLSANQYMETVTSFSASLIQSLGGNTEAAARLADQAITDMSDNANKMGTDMASIQNAYNGFAKQNYTMLDNLKLGYGGTKEEMQRLLTDAQKLSGQKFDLSSYADIVQAIHIVQTEMGITGTTAKEAASTIQGSLGMLKSAWTNLITGLGNENARFDDLVNNVVESAVTAGNNIIPRVEQILTGIAVLIEKLVPVIASKFPELVPKLLPPLLNAGASLLNAAVKALPSLAEVVISALPGIMRMLIASLADMAPELIDLAMLLMVALANGLVAAVPEVTDKLPQIIDSIVNSLVRYSPALIDAGGRIVIALATGLIRGAPQIITSVFRLGGAILDGFTQILDQAYEWGKDLILNFWQGIKDFVTWPIRAVQDLAKNIWSMLHFSEPETGPLSDFSTYAPDMMRTFAKGVEDNKSLVTDAVGSAFDLRGSMPGGMDAEGREIIVPQTPAGGNSSAVMMVDRTVFARLIYQLYNDEAARVGVRLAEVT